MLMGSPFVYKYSPRDLFDLAPSAFERPLAEFKERVEEIERIIRSATADAEAIIAAQNEDHLTDLGTNVEGAMDVSEIQRVIDVHEKLKGIYGAQFREKGGTHKILQDLIQYIVLQSKDNACLSSLDKRKFNIKDSKEVISAKSALRVLLDPAPNSKWGNYLHLDDSKIYIKGKPVLLREVLAYFWLAATDPNMPLEPKFEAKRAQCIEEEKKHVVYYLSDIRRAHNRPGDYRGLNHSIDEPSCLPGTIGRMGIHLHNLHTRYQTHVSPAKQFHRKMQAFIIAFFKTLPVERQLVVMNAVNLRIMDMSDATTNLPFYCFMAELMTIPQAEKFIDKLQEEFGGLNRVELELAMTYFIKGAIQMIYRFDQDLHERFEGEVLQKLVEKCKAEVEDVLGKTEELAEARKTLADILERIETLKIQMRTLMQRKIEYFGDVKDPQREADKLHAEHFALLRLKEKVLATIQMVGRREFQDRLLPLERSYCENSARKQILTDEELAKLKFTPYWVTKFELSFLQSEGLCKFAYLDLMRHLQLSRQKALLKLYMEATKFITDVWIQLLREIKHQLNDCLQILSPENKEKRDIMFEVDELGRLVHAFRTRYTEMTGMCSQPPFEIRDQGFLLAIFSEPALLRRCLMETQGENARWFLELSETIQKSECLLKVVAASRLSPALAAAPPISSLASSAPAALVSTSAPAAVAISSAPAPLVSSSAPAASASPRAIEISEQKKKENNPFKKLVGAFSNLTLKKSSCNPATNPNEVSGSTRNALLAAQMRIRQDYDAALEACEEHNRIPALRLLRPSLLNELEIQHAQDYIMANEHNPAALSLEDYLAPGAVVKITVANCDPAIVSFTTFEEDGEKTCCLPIPILTLKQYAADQFKLATALSHPAEILLRGYENEIAPKAEGYHILFFRELHLVFTENQPLFAAVLQRQTIDDISKMFIALLKLVKRPMDTDHPYHPMLRALDGCIERRKEEHIANALTIDTIKAFEENRIPVLQSKIMALLQLKTFVEYNPSVKPG